MGLSSVGFFVFLPVVAALYLHLPHKIQPGFLLAASWAFYLLAMPRLFVVLLGIHGAHLLPGPGHRLPPQTRLAAGRPWWHCWAILAFFKYGPALNAAWNLGLPDIAFPLGISFYTFASISYLIDASRGDCPVEKNFIIHALFVLLLPGGGPPGPSAAPGS